MTHPRFSLLIVEDDADTQTAYNLILKQKYLVAFAGSVAEGIRTLGKRKFDILILDYNLPDGTGHDILQAIRETDSDQPIIMSSGVNEAETIVKSIKLGATDYITKPVDKKVLLKTLAKVEKQLHLAWEKSVLLQKVIDSEERFHGIVGQSLAIRHVVDTVNKLKGTESSILLLGESGVGKEVVARAIHKQENEPTRPFVAVNCAAIPENLLESELFGHEKGAFTGASQTRIGKFLQANGGDIFLDEIACMSSTLQAKLLRVLQDKVVEPLGSRRQIKSNFRVIAASNQDIEGMIEKEEFRKDLYFRLQGVEIYIPPLRARNEDIPLLIEHILKKKTPQFGRRHFTDEALRIMTEYGWPGNVRELKNTVENILILNREEVIDVQHLPPTLRQGAEPNKNQGMFTHLKSNIKNYERDVIIAALKRYRGNKSRASKDLGISRSILYRKMKALDLKEDDIFN